MQFGGGKGLAIRRGISWTTALGTLALLGLLCAANSAAGVTKVRASAATVAMTEAPPFNVVAPVAGGNLATGGKLTAHPGTWYGAPPMAFSYLWTQCPGGELDNFCCPIGSGKVIVFPGARCGLYDFLSVTASNADGPAVTRRVKLLDGAVYTVVAPGLANWKDPEIFGFARPGSFLEASEGLWSGAATLRFEFHWQRCSTGTTLCSSAAGPNGAADEGDQYLVRPADVGWDIRAQVVLTDPARPGFQVVRYTPQVTVVSATAPVNIDPPVGGGWLTQGGQLIAHPGTWVNSPGRPAVADWRRCVSLSDPIAQCERVGASETYTSTPLDLDRYLTFQVVATGTDGSTAGVWSRRMGPITPRVGPGVLQLHESPRIFGIPAVNNTLEVTEGLWSGEPTGATLTFRGWRCEHDTDTCLEGPSMLRGTYQVAAADAGKDLYVEVTAKEAVGNEQTARSQRVYVPPLAVEPDPPTNTSLPTIAVPCGASPPCSPAVGDVLTASPGSWDGDPDMYAYQWRRCKDSTAGPCDNITGGVSQTYPVDIGDAGYTLTVHVTATNAGGTGEANSLETGRVALPSGAPVNVSPPTVVGDPAVGKTLSASAGAWSGATLPPRYQWQDCVGVCTNIAGAVAATYVVQPGDVRAQLRVVETASNAAGSATADSVPTDYAWDPTPSSCNETGIFITMRGPSYKVAKAARVHIGLRALDEPLARAYCVQNGDPNLGTSGHTARVLLGAQPNNYVEVGYKNRKAADTGAQLPTPFFEWVTAGQPDRTGQGISRPTDPAAKPGCMHLGDVPTWWVQREPAPAGFTFPGTWWWAGYVTCQAGTYEIPRNGFGPVGMLYDSGLPEGESWERGQNALDITSENDMRATHSSMQYKTSATSSTWLDSTGLHCRLDDSFRFDPPDLTSSTNSFTVIENVRPSDKSPKDPDCAPEGP